MASYGGRTGRLFLKRLGLFALCALVIAAAWSVWGIYDKERESSTMRAQAEAARVDLQSRESKLQADLSNVSSDRGIEQALREQYALAGQGEGLITIVDEGPSSTVSQQNRSQSWWQWLFSWL